MIREYQGESQIFPDLGPHPLENGHVVDIPDELWPGFEHRSDFAETEADVNWPPAEPSALQDLTVRELDEQYGDVDGYPKGGNKAEKLAFVEGLSGENESEPAADAA